MNDRMIDHLARKVGGFTTRRAAMKLLAGGAVAAVTGVAIHAGDDAAATQAGTCRAPGSRCAQHQDCCSGNCLTRIVRRGRQRVRVGRCAPPPPPTPTPVPGVLHDPCTVDSDCGPGLACHAANGSSQCLYQNGQTCSEHAQCDSSYCSTTCQDLPCTPPGGPGGTCYVGRGGSIVHYCSGDVGDASPACSTDDPCVARFPECGSTLTCICDNGSYQGGWIGARYICLYLKNDSIVQAGASCPS